MKNGMVVHDMVFQIRNLAIWYFADSPGKNTTGQSFFRAEMFDPGRLLVKWARVILLFAFGLALAACGRGGSSPTATVAPSPTETLAPTATPVASIVIFAPVTPKTDAEQAARSAITSFAAAHGLLVITLPPAMEIPGEIVARHPVWIAGIGSGMGPALQRAAAANPNQRFLAVEETGELPATENVLVVGGSRVRKEEQGFMAGLLAGIENANHRVGWIGESGSVSGLLYRNGFLHGVRYTCPICIVFEYEVAPGAQAAEGQALASILLTHYVETASSVPGMAGDAGLAALAGKNVRVAGTYPGFYAGVFGGGTGRGAKNVLGEPSWKPDIALAEVLPRWINGERFKYPVSYTLENGGLGFGPFPNPWISAGKQALIREMLTNIKSGRLAIGVDPVTGAEN
jgi:basic membrane lipoprotein Med (substrate-binding protein (PBP1-ABC) superfamily)